MLFEKGITVTRLRRKLARHPYGGEDVLASWEDAANVDRMTVNNCAIGPENADWQVEPWREQSKGNLSLFCDQDVDLLPGDRVLTEDGTLYEVVGHPLNYRSPFDGWAAGSVTPLAYFKG